jgi:hypothetical protein
MNVLNWAGLVINGTVAFILPLVLCSYFYYQTAAHETSLLDVEMSHTRLPKHQNEHKERPDDEDESLPTIERSLPSCLLPYRWWIIHTIIVLFVAMIVSTIVFDIVTGSGPP